MMIRTLPHEVIKSQIPVVVDFWAPGGPAGHWRRDGKNSRRVYAGKVNILCKINPRRESPRCHRSTRLWASRWYYFLKAGVQKDSSLGAVPEAACATKIPRIHYQHRNCRHQWFILFVFFEGESVRRARNLILTPLKKSGMVPLREKDYVFQWVKTECCNLPIHSTSEKTGGYHG